MLIDKPKGWTSHDVVAKVRGLLRQSVSHQSLVTSDKRLKTRAPKVRVGHAGTLDPAATGLLILVIGSYTKRAAEFLKLDKVYDCELTLGAVSTTGDVEGKITKVGDRGKGIGFREPTRKEVDKVLKSFVGEIRQVPPAYSAIKIKGQAAYKLARAGRELKMEPRVVTIYKIENMDFQYPKLSFTTKVSSGTYIRSLASDIGANLGTGAYLSGLRRTKIGNYSIRGSQSLTSIGVNDIIRI